MCSLVGKNIIELSKKTVYLTLTIVTLVIVAYAILTRSYVYLLRVNILVLIVAVVIELTSWFISAIRLRMLHRVAESGYRILPLKHYFYARLLGGLLAYLTPSAIGGEPARAYYLYLLAKNSYSKYLALALYEVFYDIVIVNTLALVLSVIKIPYTIPVLVVSSFTLTTWIIMYNVFKNITRSRGNLHLISKFVKFVENKIISRFSYVAREYLEFGSSFREIVYKTHLRDKVIITTLTIAMYLTSSLNIAIIAISVGTGEPFINQYFDAFLAFLYSLSLGAIPTPGGSVAVEYGLSIVLEPGVVVIARTVSYYLIIIAGSIVLFKIGLYRLFSK